MPEYDGCAICGSDLDDDATTVGELEVCGPECARFAWIAKEIYDLKEEVQKARQLFEGTER